jgi:hypothetical protein
MNNIQGQFEILPSEFLEWILPVTFSSTRYCVNTIEIIFLTWPGEKSGREDNALFDLNLYFLFFASSVFGRVIFKTPFSKFASILYPA